MNGSAQHDTPTRQPARRLQHLAGTEPQVIPEDHLSTQRAARAIRAPSSAAPRDILALQRAAGNRRAARVLEAIPRPAATGDRGLAIQRLISAEQFMAATTLLFGQPGKSAATFQQLRDGLAAYHGLPATTPDDRRLTALGQMLYVAMTWLASEGAETSSRTTPVRDLVVDLKNEMARVAPPTTAPPTTAPPTTAPPTTTTVSAPPPSTTTAPPGTTTAPPTTTTSALPPPTTAIAPPTTVSAPPPTTTTAPQTTTDVSTPFTGALPTSAAPTPTTAPPTTAPQATTTVSTPYFTAALPTSAAPTTTTAPTSTPSVLGTPADFAQAAHAYWKANPNTTREDFAKEILKTVNSKLLYPVAPTFGGSGGDVGAFSYSTSDFEIEIDVKAFSKKAKSSNAIGLLNYAEMAEVVDTLYHESRHAEQMLRIAQMLAAQGKTALEISNNLGIPPAAAAAAHAKPLATDASKPENATLIKEAEAWQPFMGVSAKYRPYKAQISDLIDEAASLWSKHIGKQEPLHSIGQELGKIGKRITNFFAKQKKTLDLDPHKDKYDAEVSQRIGAIVKAFDDLRGEYKNQKGKPSVDYGALDDLGEKLYDASYEAYRAYEHEKDAWARGEAAGKSFRGLEPETEMEGASWIFDENPAPTAVKS